MGIGINRGPVLSGIAATLLTVWAPSLLAQTSPGQVRDSLPLPTRPPAPAVPPPSLPETRARDASAPAGGLPVQVSIQVFEFSGNALFSSAVLAELLTPFRNRALGLAELYEAADTVERFYAAQGYPLTSVIIPPQKITLGTLQLQVVEARIGEVRFEGQRRYRKAQLEAQLPALQGQAYREAPLEGGLYRLNDLPGLQARAVIRPGAEFGTSDVVVRLRERLVEGGISVDNHGRDSIGEFRATGRLQVNNPLTLGDALSLTALGSEDGLLTYGAVGYSLPLNAAGTRAEAYYGRADYEADGALPVSGSSEEARLGIRQALTRSRRWNIDVTAGFSDIRSGVDLITAQINDTQIKLFDIGVQAVRRGPHSSTQWQLQASTDFQQLQRADLAAPTGVIEGHQRLRLQLGVLHQHTLTPRVLVLMRANGVYSPDPLLDTQAFGLGGPGSVRGYPSSEYRGDQGLSAALDVGYRWPFRGGALMPRVFIDGGLVRRVDQPAALGDDQDDASSAGIGLDLHYRALSITLDWAEPLQDRIISDGETDSRVYGTVSLNF